MRNLIFNTVYFKDPKEGGLSGTERETPTETEQSETETGPETQEEIEEKQERQLEEISETVDQELSDNLEELNELMNEAEELGIELSDQQQEMEEIRKKIKELKFVIDKTEQLQQGNEELADIAEEIDKKTSFDESKVVEMLKSAEQVEETPHSVVEFFQKDNFNLTEEREGLNYLLESGINLLELKEKGVDARIVEKKLKSLLKEQELDKKTTEQLFELYSKVGSPTDTLELATDIDVDLDQELIERLKDAAVILEPIKVIQRRYDHESEEVLTEEFKGEYELNEEQRKVLGELAPFLMERDTERYDYATKETELKSPVLEDVELPFDSFLDSLETSEKLSFNSLEIIAEELAGGELLQNFSSEQTPEEFADMQFKLHSEVEGGYKEQEKSELDVESTIERYMEKKLAHLPNREFPYDFGKDLPDLKREHLPALREELSKRWPEEGQDILDYYISVADQSFKKLEKGALDCNDNEKKWFRKEIMKPFSDFILEKESESYEELFDEQIESQTINFLRERFPDIAEDLKERIDDYEVELTSPAFDVLTLENNRGQYEAGSRTIKIKRGVTTARTPAHELIHALSQGKSKKAYFMDDDGERTSFSDGLTEAVVDSGTELLTGNHTYTREVKALNQLRFWTFSSPYLREQERPKAMEDKDLSLDFFVNALFDEQKSLEKALKEEGFDQEDRETFMEVARELFKGHEVNRI